MSLKIQTLIDEFVTIVDPAIFVAGALFIMVFLLWLVLRPLNYWYWKIEERDHLLEDMDKKLTELRHSQRNNERIVHGEEILRAIADVKETQVREAAAIEKQLTEFKKQQMQVPGPETKEEKGDFDKHPCTGNDVCKQEAVPCQGKRRYSTITDAIDKTGKVHLKEDIEKMIRF